MQLRGRMQSPDSQTLRTSLLSHQLRPLVLARVVAPLVLARVVAPLVVLLRVVALLVLLLLRDFYLRSSRAFVVANLVLAASRLRCPKRLRCRWRCWRRVMAAISSWNFPAAGCEPLMQSVRHFGS